MSHKFQEEGKETVKSELHQLVNEFQSENGKHTRRRRRN